MIDKIKENISRFLISNKLKNIVLNEHDFSEAFKRSGSFLILMPEDERDFRASYVVLDYLEQVNKALKILTRDYRISLLPAKYRNKATEFGVSDFK